MGDDRDPVVVIGAGPAGAALAWLLASRDQSVVLVERHTDFEREFRGEAMMPSGLAALAEMGLGDELATIPHAVPTRFEAYLRSRLVFAMDVTPEPFRGGRQPITVSQPHLLERIVERASAHSSFRFLRGASAHALVHEGGRCRGVVVHHEGREETLRASLVVGADGRASIVRRRAGLSSIDRGAPMDVAWAKLPWPKAWEGSRPVQGYVGSGHLLVALPAPDGQLQLGWVMLKGTFADVRSRGIEAWVEEMANHVTPELGAHLREHGGEIERPFLLKAATDHVTCWTRPGALVIGDAAHTMSPVGGQGLNLALRDAVVAANQLVPALREGAGAEALDAAAARVGALRAPEIERIQRLAALPPKLVLRRGRAADLLRAIGARVLTWPFVQARVPGVSDVFLYGTTDVRVEV